MTYKGDERWKNLIQYRHTTPQQRRENARKAGLASGQKRKERKEEKVSWEERVTWALSLPLKGGKIAEDIKNIAEMNGKNIDTQTAIILAQIIKAIKGDSRAAEFIRNISWVDELANGDDKILVPDLANFIIPHFDSIHGDIVRHNHTHYVAKGGRGSTKSSFISIEIPALLIANPDIHAVVMRKVGNTLKNSVYQQIEWAIDKLGLSNDFAMKKSPLEIKLNKTGQTITFLGVDDKSKIKSFKPPFGYVGIVWYEELDQFDGMEEIRNLNQSLLRGGDKYWCFYSFNPPKSRDNWVNIELLDTDTDRLVTHSDYRQVPSDWLGDQFILEAEKLRQKNEIAYRHEYLGEVVGSGGDVFENVSDMQMSDELIQSFDRLYHGCDFGFAVDPLAFTSMHYDAKHEDLYIFDEIYMQKLKNKTASEMILERIGKELVTGDSAEPKTIAEMNELGVNMDGARKGRDSVSHGIKWLQDLRNIYIDKRRCPNTYKEFSTYEYERNKDGQFISAYPDKNNHAIDSVRYACGKIILGSRFGW